MSCLLRCAAGALVLPLLALPLAGAQAEAFDDVAFVKKAAAGGLHEVKLGKLAKTQASNDDVRAFGARMVKDHEAANKELAEVAQGIGVTMPKGTTKKHQEEY